MAPVYFHIGFEKTGSTAVQQEFSEERDNLLENGLFYPGPGLKHPYVRYVGAHISGRELKARQKRGAFHRFNKMCEKFRSLKEIPLFLSEETVSRLSFSEIAGVRKAVEKLSKEVYCLVYVRHPLSHVISISSQNLKGKRRLIKDIENNPPITHIRDRLTDMINIFGRDRMIVRGYDPTLLSRKSIQHDVLDAVGYTGDRSFIKGIRTNEALSLPAAMVLSATTERNAPRRGKKNRMAHRQRVMALSAIPGPRFTLSHAVLKQAQDETAGDLEWLKTEFGIELPEPVVVPLEEVVSDFTEEEAMATSLRMFPSF
ncbi:hypothetical protein [Acuticoccus sediminis]|nr:hypothetical protein [Acuticoccus sediminis]